MVKTFIMLFVNILTTMRILGVICLLPIYLKLGGIAAGMLSIGCYLTDCIDGIVARKAHVSTFFGSFYDGLADKLFTVANLLVLFTITKFAIFPIACEIAIVTIQSIKFSKNANVQSSKIGKIKTWIISLTVILLYLVSDIEAIKFLPIGFVNKIVGMNKVTLYGVMFAPLYIFEILTLISYLLYKDNYDPKKTVEFSKINIKLKKAKTFKDKWNNFCVLWFNNEFYEKYKDSAGLKDIRKYVKNNR